MSTSAIYIFEHPLLTQPMRYYVHQDNHPEGAANYFWRMHKHIMGRLFENIDIQHYRGELAEVFMKANVEQAEFISDNTIDHSIHYRYEINKSGKLNAYQYCDEAKQYQLFFSDHYAEFINQYLADEKRDTPGKRLLHRLPTGMLKHTSIRYMSTYLIYAKVVCLFMQLLKTSSNQSDYQNALDDWIAACELVTDNAQQAPEGK
ncbi:MAG: hypothetical protein GY821_02615 [Gammaproteobacteria bacterium]|nr:hypothetical protein [Gammaproteobacteria bacterium]